MTGLGKYQKGLELEKEGRTGAEIAKQLGFKDTQAWYASKAYYTKKQAAFNARAAGRKPEATLEDTRAENAKQAGNLATLAGLMAADAVVTVTPAAEKKPVAAPVVQKIKGSVASAVSVQDKRKDAAPQEAASEKMSVHVRLEARGRRFAYRLQDGAELTVMRLDRPALVMAMTADEFLEISREVTALLEARR